MSNINHIDHNLLGLVLGKVTMFSLVFELFDITFSPAKTEEYPCNDKC